MIATTNLAASSKTLMASFVLSNSGIDETVRRTIGGVWVSSDQAVASESFRGAVGLVAVTDAAAAIGITAIPGPVTEASDDVWMMWMPFGGTVFFNSGVGTSEQGAWFAFDSRGMRRVPEGMQLALVAENSSAQGARLSGLGISIYSTLTT